MLIWITGISGSGKTTVGTRLCERLKAEYPNLLYLDGDEFRQACGDDLGYTLEERDKNALRMTRLCRLICAQGIHVICGANLTSQRFRDWCQAHIPDYYEVFLNVPLEVLAARDPKGLYAAALAGKADNVVGVDIPFSPPRQPFLTLENSGDLGTIDDLVEAIIHAIGLSCPEAS